MTVLLDHSQWSQRSPSNARKFVVDGKHFARDGRRFPVRGVAYGTFKPRPDDGARFPERLQMKADLAAMSDAGFTALRTYTRPSDDLLDLLGYWDLTVLAGVFWEDWRYLVGSSHRQMRHMVREARAEVRRSVRALAGCEQVFALSLGNEVPADVIRWMGTARVASVIDELVDVVREEDPARLVTYANYPTAEYLPLDSVDFLTFNVFLDDRHDLRRYITRLHNLAGDRPVVLGELGHHAGTDAEGERRQAALIAGQLETALERGVAGTFLFSWTDDWWVGDRPVEGWHFGLTRADRSPRPSLAEATRWNARGVADLDVRWPSVSVVICAYNEEATIDECLRHTCALDYPNLEIIVVDDGSTDATTNIVRRHPRARLVSIEHAGLSTARNEGFARARGEIVAYLDADAYPSPEWPYYLVLAFDGRDIGGAGGPNLPPVDDPLGAQVVAQSAGGPVHVLLSDDRAEHVPGCNMAFWRAVLEEVGGFDPIYTSARDDVDLCWKVLDRRWSIGFHPAAVVWHHRRPGLRRYLRQQQGYGRAEALVEARHPDRFSPIGTARWRGRVYNALMPSVGRARIYRGVYGAAAYQSVYRGGGHLLDLAHQIGIPLAAGVLLTAPLALLATPLLLPAVIALVALAALGVVDAIRAQPPRGMTDGRLRFRASVAVHNLLQPLVRTWGRCRAAPSARRDLPSPVALADQAKVLGGGVVLLAAQRSRVEVTHAVVTILRRQGARIEPTTGWEGYDARFRLSHVLVGELLTSEHPVGNVQVRVRPRVRRAPAVAAAVAVVAAAAAGAVFAALTVLLVMVDIATGLWRARITMPRTIAAAAADRGDHRSRSRSNRVRERPGRIGGRVRQNLKSWPLTLPYLRPHKRLVAASMVFMILGAGVALLEPWPIALMVDSVLGEKPLPGLLDAIVGSSVYLQVALVAALLLGVTLATNGLTVLTNYVNTKIDMRMVLSFRSELFQHVQRLSFDYHDDRLTGEFMGRINGQASSVGGVTVSAFPLVQSALTLVGMFWVAFRINPPVALLSLTVVPFIYYSTGYYGSRIGPEVRRVKGLEIRSLHLVHEAVQMLRVIVAFNREGDEYRKFREQGEQAADARVKVTVKQTLFNLVVNLITAAGTAAVLGLGAYEVRAGNLSVGQLLVLLAYIRSVYTPLETISATMNSIQEQLIGFEMALELLDAKPEVVEKPDARPLPPARGSVAFERVSFDYKGREGTLQDISFQVAPGESVAIVGPTGAGKSTLLSLLPRFYDPRSGVVRIDGVDIRDVTLSSLRSQIALVMQEPLLFTGTIEDNIRYGRPDATRQEVIAAAKAANAHDFIMKLPSRYRTKLGERGSKLSGGERQRISVARAFLKDSPILLLDEPTSSIDSRTEAIILEAIERLMKGRTTFMVAHRLSTVRNASQILVLDHGRIVEYGTHDDLMTVGGLYRMLYDAQRSGSAAASCCQAKREEPADASVPVRAGEDR